MSDVDMINLLQEIEKNQRATVSRLESLEHRVEEHAKNSKANHVAIMEAFPGNDPEGHRRYHETQIQMLEEKRQLRKAIQEKTISGLIWAGIVSTITAVYQQYFHK